MRKKLESLSQPCLYLLACIISTANYELLTLMVNASADLNVIDERDGSRPLHAAIIKGDKADGTLLTH